MVDGGTSTEPVHQAGPAIVPVRAQDRPQLLALNNDHAAELSLLDEASFAQLVDTAFIALQTEDAAALVIAFDQAGAYDSPNFLWFRERFERFVYVDRVVVSPAARGRGLARALYDSGQISEAVTALAAIEEIDPDWPNLHLRMASWMTEEGRIEDAVPVLESAVAHGATPDQAANMIFSFAYSNYVQPQEKNYSRFIELVLLAKEFEVGLEAREQYDFWHGYSIFTLAIEAQTAEDVAGANRSLPMFRQALGLFQEGKGYADRTASIEYQVYVDNTNTYIEIQDAIIRRANR